LPFYLRRPTDKRVADALEYLVEQSMTKQWAATTLDMFADKSGHLLRLLGEIALVELRSPALKQYIDRRLTEGAARETVRKELSTLRAALREAVELAWMPEELANGCIPRFAAKYKPRERWLSVEEYTRLLMALPAKRRTWLAMAVYLGGRFSELEGAAWSDVDLEQATLRLRGTKTDGADRFVPIPGPLLDVLRRVPKSDRIGTIAERWTNVRRDLAIACQLAGIQPVTPNDLRRTYASWLVNEGVPLKTISRLLGHKSTRMVDLVYGRLADETLAAAVARLPVTRMPSPTRKPEAAIPVSGSKWVAEPVVLMAPMASRSGTTASISCVSTRGETATCEDLVVPRDGIEPPTRGFSVRCSTS
jgi:integrase